MRNKWLYFLHFIAWFIIAPYKLLAAFSDSDSSHFFIETWIVGSRSLFSHGLFGILQEFQRGFSRIFVFHFVNGLANETQQVVDILSLNKGVLLVLIEEQVCVENLD